MIPLLLMLALPARGESLMSLLPPHTAVAIESPDVPRLIADWKASPFYRFYRDPRTRNFFAPADDLLDRLALGMRERRGLEPGRFGEFFNGRLLIAALPPSPGAAPAWVMVLEHNADPAILAQLRKGPAVDGVVIETRTVAGFEVRRMTLPALVPAPASAQAAQPPVAFDQFFGRGLLIHAEGAQGVIDSLLERLADDSQPSLLSEPAVARTLPTSTASGDIQFYLNVPMASTAWLEPVVKQYPLVDLAGLGLRDIAGLGARIDLARDQLALDLRLNAPAPHRGLARLLFLGDPLAASPALDLPASAPMYVATGIPLAEAWAALVELAETTLPDIAPLATRQLEAAETATEVSIARDLLGSCENRLIRLQLPASARNANQSVFMIPLHDRQRFARSLKTLLDYGSRLTGAYHLDREARGEVEAFWLRPGRAGGNYQARALLGIMLDDQAVLLGADVPTLYELMQFRVDRRLGKNSPALAATPAFKSVSAQWPPDRHWEAFVDLPKILSRVSAQSIPRKTTPNPLVDTAMFPGPEVWRDYFGPLGAARTRQQEILILYAFILYP